MYVRCLAIYMFTFTKAWRPARVVAWRPISWSGNDAGVYTSDGSLNKTSIFHEMSSQPESELLKQAEEQSKQANLKIRRTSWGLST